MSRNRFVDPDTKRIDLTDGDWIEVKTRLSWGDVLTIQASSVTGASTNGDQVTMDMRRHSLTRIAVWLVDWSLVDGNEKRVKLSMDALAALDQETADEIDAALTAHIEAIEAEKKVTKPGKK